MGSKPEVEMSRKYRSLWALLMAALLPSCARTGPTETELFNGEPKTVTDSISVTFWESNWARR
jgi:hypothetical protein